MESLDNILSGQREAAPETPEPVVQETQQTEPQEAAQPETGSEQPEGQKTVPHAALHAEKQKVKRYTEEVSDLRREIAERDAAWERRIAQLMEAQKPPRQEQAPPDWFENPAEATKYHTSQMVGPQFEQIGQTLLAFAKDNAITRYSEEKVNEAERAFIDAVQSRQLDPADYQAVVGSPNRYAAAVQWHQRQLAKQEIGDDPAAYKAKVEAEIREKVLAELKQGGERQPTTGAPVMPSNLATVRNVGTRSGPAWGGPTPLNDIFKR